MVYQKLRKVGNSYVVTIPKDEVTRMNLSEGQMLAVEVRPVAIRPGLSPELAQFLEETWECDEPAYRYLAGR
jgi:antitoxin component of MazEF toxin-antitoxin module